VITVFGRPYYGSRHWYSVSSVCRLSSVCLGRFVFWRNGWTNLHEIFREGVEWPWDDLITFWVNSGKPRDAAMLISLSATLREEGWTDLDAIFREGVEWPWDSVITFWVNSHKPCDAAMLISLSATLWEDGRTDLHEIFREGVEWPWDDLITFWVNSGKPRNADYKKTAGPICMNAPQLLHSLWAERLAILATAGLLVRCVPVAY